MYTYQNGNSAFSPLHPTICIKISFVIDTTVMLCKHASYNCGNPASFTLEKTLH